VKLFVSGLGLIPKAFIITVVYGLDCYASYFLPCFPDVYDFFSDVIVLDCDLNNLIILIATLLPEISLFVIIIHLSVFFCNTRPYILTKLTLVLLTFTIASVMFYIRL
jgi:hypothetical protein